METKKVLTIEDVADLLGYSRAHIERLMQEGKIPFHKPFGKNGKTFFNCEELEKTLFSGKGKGVQNG